MAVLTSEQDVESFLNRETVASDLPNLRKDELLLISDYLELNFTKANKKADILAAVLDSLGVSQREEAEEADPGKPPTPVAEGLEESMQEVDEELEKLKLQLELGKLEAASREKELAFTSARDERQKKRNRQEREREYERQKEKEERDRQEREREYERQKERRKIGSMS